MELTDLTELELPQQLAAVAAAMETVADYCSVVRANIPPELIVERLGDPQVQLAANAGQHLRVVAAAIRSLVPSPPAPQVPRPTVPQS